MLFHVGTYVECLVTALLKEWEVGEEMANQRRWEWGRDRERQ